MTKNLVIVFVKNIKLGKVKTRLAKTIGEEGAFQVYKELVEITAAAISSISDDKRIYFSDSIIATKWPEHNKAVQRGNDLGERMKNAFQDAFNDGYQRVVLIGSDLPEISAKHIKNALSALEHKQTVFGPAIDGGYYLIGLSKMIHFPFENKPWSKANLLSITKSELIENNISFTLLEELNDIDTFEDLEASSFYRTNKKLQHRIQQLNA